jgi:hypothetical protein
MIFVFPITIPANTPETAKQKTILPLARGRVTRVMIEFPAGHVGLTHLYIRRGLFQVWPANPEVNFKSSNETIIWDEDYALSTPPLQLEAYAWNEDDTYEHTITVRIVLEPAKAAVDILDELRTLLTSQEATAGG